MGLDELDELEDEEDEKVFLEYRAKRLAELQLAASKVHDLGLGFESFSYNLSFLQAKYGAVLEISGQDYVQEVNKAGDGVWVVLHLYRQG